MYDRFFVGSNVTSFSDSPQFDGYSKVVISVSDDIEYSAGTDSGRTLTLTCPWGNQDMANKILEKIIGVQYQPYKSTGTIIDPAMELGDAVTVRGVYGGVFSRRIKFGRSLRADIGATSDEEIEHEFPYISKQERKVTRQFKEAFAQLSIQSDRITAEVSAREDAVNEINAQLAIQADQISAKVSQTGGNSSTFGWQLLSTAFKLQSNGQDVFIADKNGVQVVGKITATSGKIGGFDIMSNYLTYNSHTWGGTNTTGLYLGTSGLQIGRNCKIDMQGNAEFANAYVKGTLRAGDINYGGDDGYFPGYGLDSHTVPGSRLEYGTVSTSYTSGGINTSLAYADFSNSVFQGSQRAPYVWVNTVIASGAIQFRQKKLALSTIRYKNTSGENAQVNVVTWGN